MESNKLPAVKNSAAQVVKATNQQKNRKTGKVTVSEKDLRSGK